MCVCVQFADKRNLIDQVRVCVCAELIGPLCSFVETLMAIDTGGQDRNQSHESRGGRNPNQPSHLNTGTARLLGTQQSLQQADISTAQTSFTLPTLGKSQGQLPAAFPMPGISSVPNSKGSAAGSLATISSNQSGSQSMASLLDLTVGNRYFLETIHLWTESQLQDWLRDLNLFPQSQIDRFSGIAVGKWRLTCCVRTLHRWPSVFGLGSRKSTGDAD